MIRSAWWRSLCVLFLEQLPIALAIVLGGCISILILGTQILDWRLPTLLTITASATVAVRVRHRMLNRYEVAQLLDKRLKLADSLSTAWFLLSATQPRALLARAQIDRAAELAGSVDIAAAFPIRRNHSWLAVTALAAGFVITFALRYATDQSLSFERSLIPLHLGFITERTQQARSSMPEPNRQVKESKARDKDNASGDSRPGERNVSRSPDTSTVSASAYQNTNAQSNPNAENGRAGSPSEVKSSARQSSDSRTSPNATDERLNQTTPDARQNASLLNRMQDALSGLLSKMSSTQSQKFAENGDRRSATDSEHSNQHRQSTASNAPKGDESADNAPDRSNHGQTAEKPQASQGRNSGSSSDQNGSNDRSGIGSQDGEKSLKESDQMQAMGKLAEIIGKRSASVTGEVTIERPASKQQLKTGYSKQMGRHADLGGEINRDEVPLIYQQYVRDYMEQVHKQPK